MDRFHFPHFFVYAVAVGATVAVAAPRELPGPGVIAQLRPGAVVLAEPVAPAVRRDSSQALREQAQAAWQRQHTLRTDRLKALAVEAGVPVVSVGSAGTALRLDFAQPLTGEPLQAAMRRLRLHPDVASVTPNVRWQRQQSTTTPNDPLFAQQWHLQAPTVFASALNLPAAWALNTGTANAPVVAVVDGGVRFDHPDLKGRLLSGHDFVSELSFANDGNGRDVDASDPGDWVNRAESLTTAFDGCEVSDSTWHGTAIAGQIAAATHNGLGVAGVSWGARVLPVRVAGKCGALLSDLLDGMRWAAGLPVEGAPVNPTPAKVINLSYGGSGACDDAYQQTMTDVAAAGALVVVAAGNASVPLTRPADCRDVLAVAAVRGDGAKASYASYGSNVALSVPGGSGVTGTADEGLLTTLNSGRTVPLAHSYQALAGSSFAAPLVAGTAALMWSVQPSLSAADVARLLKASVRPHTVRANLPTCNATATTQSVCNCTTATCGSGLLDAQLALVAASTGVGSAVSKPTPAAVVQETSDGGGGFVGWWWGLALWAWAGGLAVSRRRRPSPVR